MTPGASFMSWFSSKLLCFREPTGAKKHNQLHPAFAVKLTYDLEVFILVFSKGLMSTGFPSFPSTCFRILIYQLLSKNMGN